VCRSLSFLTFAKRDLMIIAVVVHQVATPPMTPHTPVTT
jgi:hypothetical protein